MAEQKKNPAAVALGRLGGEANRGITSDAKRESAQLNGTKGGRPSRYSRAEMQTAIRRLKNETAMTVADDVGVAVATIWAWKRKMRAPAKATIRLTKQR
jgi:hypothetical protein